MTHADPQQSTIEAVAVTPLFHFRDDIAIRVRQGRQPGTSQVDLRSRSRSPLGNSDFGRKAQRIRQFFVELTGQTGLTK